MRIDFWDVGQGNSSVLTLPDGQLVIIDVGPRTSPLYDWLSERPKVNIHSLILTHNHTDHVGAIPSIIKLPNFAAGTTIYVLRDPAPTEVTFLQTMRPIYEAFKLGRCAVHTLTAGQEIWQDASLQIALQAVYPDFFGNDRATTSNQTSGIIVLKIKGEVKVIWPGDAMLKHIASTAGGGAPYILDGPHHGGPQDYKPKNKICDQWIRSINSKRCHISVGTTNGDHPRPKYIKHLVKLRCRVTCTQLTKECEPTGISQTFRPILQTHALLGLRPPRRGVACRGPLQLTLIGHDLVPDKWDGEHKKRIEERVSRPLCLAGK